MNPKATRRTRNAERARRARPLALAILLARCTGWLGIALGVCVVAIERSGFAEHLLREEIARRLAPLGSTAEFDRLNIDWLGPGVTLEGFRVSKDGVTHLTTERLYVAMDLSPALEVSLTRLDLDGGLLRVREALVEDVRALLELRPDSSAAPRAREVRLPSLQVRGFQLEFEGPQGRTHGVGSVDLSLESKPRRPARISGRLVLPSRAGVARSAELYLHGIANLSGQLELFASAKDLAIEAWRMPDLEPFDQIIAMQPEGRFQLQSSARLNLLAGGLPDMELRLSLEDARLEPPRIDSPLEAVDLSVSAHFNSFEAAGFADSSAWSGGGVISATWAEQDIAGGLRLGNSAQPGQLAKAWLRAPQLDLQTPELLAIAPRVALMDNLFTALEPEGEVDVILAVSCEESWRLGEPLAPRIEHVLRLIPSAPVRAAWRGWSNPEFPELIPLGFPMPALTDEGAVYAAHNTRFPRRELLDVDFHATHATGPARVTYQQWSNPIDMPPFAPGYGKMESDLFVITPNIAIDDSMRECLYGLRQIPELETLFEDYGLTAGRADAMLRVAVRASIPKPAVELNLEVQEVEAALAAFPIPAHEMHGQFSLRDGGSGRSALRFSLEATTDSARSVHVSGRQRSVPLPATAEQAQEGRVVDLDHFELEVNEVDLEGSDVRFMAETLPEFGDSLAGFAPKGRASARITHSGETSHSRAYTSIEVTPEQGTTLLPRVFPMHSTDIRGRVLVELREVSVEESGDEAEDASPELQELEAPRELAVSSRIAPLIGRWVGGAPVSLSAEFPSDGSGHGRVLGAALRPGDSALVDGIAGALGGDGDAVDQELGGLDISGAVDVAYQFEFPPGDGPALMDYTFFLRDNDLRQVDGEAVQSASLEIEQLAGVIGFEQQRLTSESVRCDWNGTPVLLTDLLLEDRDGVPTLDATVHAEGLSLDRGLLRQFLAQETVGPLMDQLGFRGRVDVEAAHLVMQRQENGEYELELSGSAKLSDVFAEVGLPLSIRSAQLDLEEFVISGDEVRGWGRIHDLYGLALDRDFSQANLLISYYGSRLSVDTLEGSFCGGRIHGAMDQQESTQLSGPVFSVDLRDPFAFQANVAIEEVDLGLLLEEVFSSEIANQGFASGEARLGGELTNLLSITGSGRVEVRDSVLWSVPVLRDLFTQLGYDSTAIFDDMSTQFRVENGSVYMEDMLVHSPLLNLSGRGTLGLDGALNHDLQVKYSLVDKAGPLGSLIHLLQDTLLSVSIRGDMARPRVFLRGALTGPFQSVDEGWRAIPLPGYSPLPERF